MDIAAGAVRLPNELWDLVLENLEHEPVVLWLTCRQVCRGFRDAVELAFRRNVLSKALVEYKAATPIRLTFAGFSDDGKNAILRDAEPESHYTREFWNLRDIISQWKWTVGGYTGHSLDRSPQEAQPPRFDQPLYTIHLVGRVNDTVLPGLHIDFAERLIEFDWKAMFDRFYHEEAAILDRKLYLFNRLAIECPNLPQAFDKYGDDTRNWFPAPYFDFSTQAASDRKQLPRWLPLSTRMRVQYLAYELTHAARSHVRKERVLKQYANSKCIAREDIVPTDLWFVKQSAYEEMPDARVVEEENEASNWREHYDGEDEWFLRMAKIIFGKFPFPRKADFYVPDL